MNTLKKIITSSSLVTLAVASFQIKADKQTSHFGYEGGLTAIAQGSDQKKNNSGIEASADLLLYYQKNQWQVSFHLEGNLPPSKNSITNRLPESNADAFSAVDQYNNGRLQLSELSISYTPTQAVTDRTLLKQFTFGLIDATAFFDNNAVMNDENTQFIAAPFVNNPTIDFPDYTLGVSAALQLGFKPHLETQVGIFSGKGLADNANRDYNETTKIDLDSKGILTIAETQLMHTPLHHLSVGAWLHSGDHTDINDATKTDLINYGFYLTGSHQMHQNTFAVRLGYSRPETNERNKFISLAVQHQYNSQWITGMAADYQMAAISQTKDSQSLEAYAQYQPFQNDFFITPSLQYFHNSSIAKSITVANLRLSYQF